MPCRLPLRSDTVCQSWSGTELTIHQLLRSTTGVSSRAPVVCSYVRDIAKELSPYKVATLQFADEISIRSSSMSADEVSQNLSSAVQHLADWLRNCGLILNETKTRIMPISPVRPQKFDLQVQCNGLPLPTVRSAKYLGLHFDADMSWNTMVDEVAQGVASKVGVLRRYATFLPSQCRIAYLRSFILSHFLYAASAYLPFFTRIEVDGLMGS